MTGGTTGMTGGSGPIGGSTGTTGGVGGAGGSTGPTGGRTGRGGTTAAGGATGGGAPTGGDGGATGGSAPTGGDGGAATGGSTGTGGGPVAAEPVLITSSDGNWWKEGTVTTGSGNATITVNASTTYQKWLGFGGSFNEKGWDALSKLSAADRELAIKLLFSKTEGAGFVYGRVPIGASDYGTDRYTLNDNAGDTSMSKFSIERDKQRLIPFIKAALAVNPDIILWATVWTPPPWMKSNNAYDRGSMKGDATTLTAYALYLSKFVQAYAGEGIKIAAVGPQNEPGYEQDYPSCAWSSGTYKDFVANYMGPKFEADSPSTEIWLATMSNPSSTSIVSAVMGDSKAKGYIKAIGLQWGMMDQGANYARTYSPLPIIQTEHKCGNYPWEGGYRSDKAPNDLAYGNESWGYIRDWITKQSGNSYSAWNMVLDTIGRSLDNVRPWNQNAPLAVDTGASKLIQTPTYYVFRHASQFVDPGAVRVQTSTNDGFAFKNPDGHIVLVMKTGGGGQTTVGIGSTTLSFQAPANGWVTLNYQGG
ncbi:MAG: glucosylceramidase [Polyangiaceae bacterium]|nr:glucosylceramidase [Polyangiaceae bacterium]